MLMRYAVFAFAAALAVAPIAASAQSTDVAAPPGSVDMTVVTQDAVCLLNEPTTLNEARSCDPNGVQPNAFDWNGNQYGQ